MNRENLTRTLADLRMHRAEIDASIALLEKLLGTAPELEKLDEPLPQLTFSSGKPKHGQSTHVGTLIRYMVAQEQKGHKVFYTRELGPAIRNPQAIGTVIYDIAQKGLATKKGTRGNYAYSLTNKGRAYAAKEEC